MTPQEIEKIKEEFDRSFCKLRHDGYMELQNLHAPDLKSFIISHINELLKVRGEGLVNEIEKIIGIKSAEYGGVYLINKRQVINLIQSDLSTNPSSQDEEK